MSEGEQGKQPLFLEKGKYPQHGKASNPNKSNQEVAAGARVANLQDNLLSLVLNENEIPEEEKKERDHKVLLSIPIKLPDKDTGEEIEYRVSLVGPRSPYTEIGTMVCVANVNALRKGKIQTQTIYDYPPEVQS